MATQRLTVATIAGHAAGVVALRFEHWQVVPDPAAIDRLCVAVRENAMSLAVVYYTEWVDRWLMGDSVPGPGTVEGRRFQAAVFTPDGAAAWAGRCGTQFAEQQWLAARLREAGAGWGVVSERYAVVVLREVLGSSTTDDEVRAALGTVPAWLMSPDPSPDT